MIDGSSLRIGVRTLGRHRGFTTVAALSIAVAIALNTTMYSALDKLVDPQISARDPERVYTIRFFSGPQGRQLHPSVVQDALRDGIPGLEAVSGLDAGRFTTLGAGLLSPGILTESGDRHTRTKPAEVQANFFEFLGTPAIVGRTFSRSDAGTATAVISDRLAARLFGDRTPVGEALLLQGDAYGIVGVVRRTQLFEPLSYDLWVLRPANMRPVAVSMLRFRERLEPFGLRKQLDLVARRIELAAGDPPGSTAFGGGAFVRSKRPVSTFDTALVAAVLAVLLVACANLANLQLARGLARTRELALRSAVGASRGRLVQQLLLETGLIALVGLALGVVLTLWGIDLVRATIPPSMDQYYIEPQANWRMFAFAASAAVVCLVLIGLLPALRVSRVDPAEMLKSGAGTGASRQHRKRYGLLVVAQIGFALPVLIASIVLVKTSSMYGSREFLVGQWYGYDPSPMVIARVPYAIRSGAVVPMAGVSHELLSIARTVPGVLDAAVETTDWPEKQRVTVDDENGVIRDEAAYGWAAHLVSPSYLRVFGHRMQSGRDFTDTEFDGNSVIIDERTGRFLWGNRDPIGRVIKFGDASSGRAWYRVVGVVGDQRDSNAVRRMDPYANYRLNAVYRVISPADTFDRMGNRRRQVTSTARWMEERRERYADVKLYVRVRGNVDLAAVRLQRALRTRTGTAEPTVVPMLTENGIDFWRTRSQFAGSLFSAFAFIGLALVAIGVYGIVAHSVAERRREIAVRISLGATARDILRAVLREGNSLILAGVAFGLYFSKVGIRRLPFAEGIYVTNAPLYALVATFLFTAAAVAALLPALRATRIDPVEALRHE